MRPNKSMFCSVITPTYNRASILRTVFSSLCEQDDLDFEWIVCDDGSTDSTSSVVQEFALASAFPIIYLRKENGGKHTAVNMGVGAARGEMCLLLDSDDQLTSDAIATAKKIWREFRGNTHLCGLSFLAQTPDGSVIGRPFPEDFYISDHYRCRVIERYVGDKCELYRAEILKAYPFPIIGGEKFIREGIVWNRIGDNYQTVYVNHPILVKQYLADGVSRFNKRAQLRSPRGAALYAREMLQRPTPWWLRWEFWLQYTCYSVKSRTPAGRILQDSGYPWQCAFFLPAGALLCWYWSAKYDRI